jgi:RNA polymerase sigma-70 factor (ECF subfamily)
LPIEQRKESSPDPLAESSASAETSAGIESSAGRRIPVLPPDFKARFAAADPDALARFYETYFDRVYGYVRRMLSEDHVAEDVTQDIFLHIQRSAKTYDPARELDPWVFAIATNKVRDFWRSRRHRDDLQATSLDDTATRYHPASTSGPLPTLESAELKSILDRAIDELPEGMRSTLILRYFEGMSFESIAQMYDRNEAAVRKRYSRALGELRRILEKRHAGPEGGRA